MISNFDDICRDSYNSIFLDEWNIADPQDKEAHRKIVAAVYYALEGGAA